MEGVASFTPLTHALPFWPADQWDVPGLEYVGLSHEKLIAKEGGVALRGRIVVLRELVFSIPGFDGLSFAVASQTGRVELPFEVELEPAFHAKLDKVTLELRFAASFLKPMRKRQDGAPGFEPDTSKSHVSVATTLSLSVDAEANVNITGGNAFSLPPVMVGETGVVFEARNVALDLSRETPIPQTTRAGLPDSWVGAVIEEARVTLPADLRVRGVPLELAGKNLFIGSGGFGGRIEASWNTRLARDRKSHTGAGAANLFGMPCGVKRVALGFQQNNLTESDIKAGIILPFFDQPVGIDLGLTGSGDFSLALSAEQPQGVKKQAGLIELEVPNVIRLRLKSLRFERKGNTCVASLAGSLKPMLPGDWPEVDVKGLKIDSEGNVQIDGGWLELAQQKRFSF
jgi:hypothetical protein